MLQYNKGGNDMIDINDAIGQSKNMKDISDGGSQCFDFGDVILVRYTALLKYVKDNYRSRENEEVVMEGVNQKIQNGVNTPKHLAMKRTIEDDRDVCYVLQEKCKGINCASMSEYGVSYDKMISDLEFVYNIPFEHYKKLISDGCQLYDMGYEKKNKNLFYDKETGFWYIDLLEYDKDNPFDINNPVKVFEALRYIIPNPIQIASTVKYKEALSAEQQEKKELLMHSIEAKNLLAIKSIIPSFERYEKFYLFSKSDGLKRYLMDQGIIDKDLFRFESADYPVYDELYEIVINQIIDKIVNKGEKFWSIETNDITNDSNLFCLIQMWALHKDNTVNRSDFEDKYDYEDALRSTFKKNMLSRIAQILEGLESNDNIVNFLNDMCSKYEGYTIK